MITDLSYWNRPINWDALRAAGVICVICRGPIGASGCDLYFAANWARAKTFPRQGIYGVVDRTGSAAAQVANFLKVCGSDFGTEPLALDVERTTAERESVANGWLWPKVAYTGLLRDMLLALAARTPVRIYTSRVEWEAMTTRPEWAAEYPLWVAHYNDHIAAPDVPAGWVWQTWQYGQVTIAGHSVDVNRERVPMVTNSIPTGCLVGGGAESNSDIIPIYTALARAGAVPPIIIGVENPGLCVDAKRLGVPTCVARFMHPETGDDHDFEAGGSGRLGWSAEKRLRFARASVALAFDHMNPTEAAAVDYVQCAGNEWDAQDVGEWLATCDVWALVLDERDNRQAEYVRKNGKPLRLAMGIFNAGTPKTWPMYQAIFSHPVFGRMHEAGDFIGFHEGVAFGQPKDELYNVPLLGGAPIIPGSGLLNFRSDYALAVLDSHGWAMPYGFLEEYDGFTRNDPVEKRIDYLTWIDQHMGTMGPATRKWFRGTCAFELTNNPASAWFRQDFSPVLRDARWQAYAVSQIGRINGTGDDMPNVSDSDLSALSAAVNTMQSATATANGILARYQPAGAKHTMSTLTGQAVINVFSRTFNGLAVLSRINLTVPLADNRGALYTGPAVEDLALTDAEKAALISALGAPAG